MRTAEAILQRFRQEVAHDEKEQASVRARYPTSYVYLFDRVSMQASVRSTYGGVTLIERHETSLRVKGEVVFHDTDSAAEQILPTQVAIEQGGFS